MKDNKYEWINVLKGIGILSVVIGHSCNSIASRFVYSYHLALFFFVSGFLYNEKKYGYNPYLNLGNRFKSCYWKYVLYASLLALFNNWFVRLGIVSQDSAGFSFYDFRNYVLNTMVLNNTNPLFGPSWFVLALICSASLTGFIIYAGNIVYSKTHKIWMKHLVIFLFTIVGTLLGVERFKIGFQLYARLDVGLFVLPIVVAGYYCRTYLEKIKKIVCWPGAIVSLTILILVIYKLGWSIDLCGQHAKILQFLILSFAGIYLMTFLSQKIVKIKFLSFVFSKMGIYSFEIMCFHFLCFKFVDLIFSKIINETDYTKLSLIPHSYNLGIVYVIIGCAIPVLVSCGIHYITLRVLPSKS